MTDTRHPTGQDLTCLVCGKGDNIDIDHVVNRGMGGSKERDVPENKVPLCRGHHEAKTNGVLETEVYTPKGRGLYYKWRRKGGSVWLPVPVEVSERYRCLVLRDGAEGVAAPPYPSASSPSAGIDDSVLSAAAEKGAGNPDTRQDNVSLAAALSAKEEDDGTEGSISDGDVRRPSVGDVPVGDSISSSLTHEQRVAIAANIKDAEWNRQWIAGDTGNLWIAELGESAEQYLSDFGYVHESLANILRVCAAIPPAFRHGNLRFSHHVIIVDLNREDMEMWLDKCEEEQWSVAEFRRQVKGTKPKVKRWSLGELLGELTSFEAGKFSGIASAQRFLDWLGEQA